MSHIQPRDFQGKLSSDEHNRTTYKQRIQVRLRHRHRVGHDPEGLDRRHRPSHLGEEERAGVDARVSAEGVPPLAEDEASRSTGRTSRTRRSIFRTSSTTPRRSRRRRRRAWTRSIRNCCARSRSSASRSPSRRSSRTSRSMRSSTRSRSRRPTRRSSRSTASSSARSPRRSQDYPELIKKYLGSVVPVERQLLRGAQLRGLLRRLVRLHSEGRPLPDGAFDLLPHQHAGVGTVRAHADRRRRGRATSPTSKAAPRRSSTRTSCTRRSSSWSRWTTPRSSTRRCRTGTRATRTGKGGIYNFVTKRGACRGVNSKISWTQVETGSAITWKYPSCILQGDNSIGEFYSVALTNNAQMADTGTKMIHIGKNTSSTIISKGISAGKSNNSYRGLVKVMPKARRARATTRSATRC